MRKQFDSNLDETQLNKLLNNKWSLNQNSKLAFRFPINSKLVERLFKKVTPKDNNLTKVLQPKIKVTSVMPCLRKNFEKQKEQKNELRHSGS